MSLKIVFCWDDSTLQPQTGWSVNIPSFVRSIVLRKINMYIYILTSVATWELVYVIHPVRASA
jgi:hypothetical protein